jgi:nitrogenase molybdenum-iron protein NifN
MKNSPPAMKPLSVNPLKSGQPIGAALAVLGLAKAMPLEHSARGCTSFDKLFLMRHFHEPIALQTTAMDQITTILGADGNVVEALATICRKNAPAAIGLITTGLSEMQGADIPRTMAAFRSDYPQYDDVAIVPVSASDTLGCLETGFAAALTAMIDTLVPQRTKSRHRRRPRQVNILASAMLTPGDIDAIKGWAGAFGLVPIVLPDIGDSLDGHLTDEGFSTLTYGGTALPQIAAMADSEATLVIGASVGGAADVLKKKTGIPDYRFSGLMGLETCDGFTDTLRGIAKVPVPASIERERARLQDALVDCQFQVGSARVAVAADADLLATIAGFMTEIGADVVAAVASARADYIAKFPGDNPVVGDLEDLETLARQRNAELVVTNSHGADIAARLGAAHLRAGFPIYDSYGAHLKCWVGYGGSRQILFDVANLMAAHYREIEPYRSRYWRGTPRDDEIANRSC